MGIDPIIDSRTGKVVGSCWSRECSKGCGKDSLDLPDGVHQCNECRSCPDCCDCSATKEESPMSNYLDDARAYLIEAVPEEIELTDVKIYIEGPMVKVRFTLAVGDDKKVVAIEKLEGELPDVETFHSLIGHFMGEAVGALLVIKKARVIVANCVHHRMHDMGILEEPPPSLEDYSLRELLDANHLVRDLNTERPDGPSDYSHQTMCDDRLIAALYTAYHYEAQPESQVEPIVNVGNKALCCVRVKYGEG